MGFYHRLNYSFGNEIWQAESLALGITNEDSVLCITASGDRPLHVLLDNPRRVLAIDSDPNRNYLLEIKIRAMRTLSYNRYLAFIGAIPSYRRVKTCRGLRHSLPSNGELPAEPLPHRLQQASYDYIRDRVDRIEIATADVASHLQSSSESFDVFSVSDIASYTSYAGFVETLHMIRKRAKAGARFCIREYVTRYGIPDSVADNFIRDAEREQMAQACETNVAYRFIAGHIR